MNILRVKDDLIFFEIIFIQNLEELSSHFKCICLAFVKAKWRKLMSIKEETLILGQINTEECRLFWNQQL